MTPEDFAKFAVDRRRLAVLGHLAARPASTAELMDATHEDQRDILEWVGLLAVEGLVTKDEETGRWTLKDEGLIAVADQLPRPPPPSPRVFFGMTEEEGEVLAKYVAGQRLTDLPMKRSDRLVVLERLALEFEPGQHYDERQVNGMLSLWNPDYARLRRALVDEGFMDRANGQYWRAGGRVTGVSG